MSYNTFFSSLTPRSEPCLTAKGFELPVTFPTIKDRAKGVEAEPDFLLYDGNRCCLVEVKGGNNFEDRHIRQMSECNSITIEKAQEYLRNAEISKRTSYDGNVDVVETAIVYQGIHEAFISNCRTNWDDCREKLERLEEETPILAQEKGGKLRTVAGEFETEFLDDLFNEGIRLPPNPKKEFALTEAAEKESLAVAICNRWGQRAATGPVKVTPSEIRHEFSPRHAINFGKIRRVLHFLTEIEACELINEEEEIYEFTVDHMGNILGIQETVNQQSIEEYLREDGQTELEDF